MCMCRNTAALCVFNCACVCAWVGGGRHRECDSVSGTQSSDTPPPSPLPFSLPSNFRLRLSSLSPLPANPASLSRSLHRRRPTQTPINNSDRVALQVSPRSAPAASSPHPPISLQKKSVTPPHPTLAVFLLFSATEHYGLVSTDYLSYRS